jgi:uncharacterized protein (TIGR02145 family)
MSHSDAGDIPVELGKTTATELCQSIAMPPSEFALQICDDIAAILQDFTTDKNKILTKIKPITANGNNDFVEQLSNNLTGLLNIAKTGKNKRVAIIYTDAWWYALSPLELQNCKDTCTKYNIQFYAIIYSRPEAEINGIKSSLNSLANATGGIMFDGITSISAAKVIAFILQKESQNSEHCEIEWQSGISCQSTLTNVELKLNTFNLITNTNYQPPISSVSKLEFIPESLNLKFSIPGIKKDTTINITAQNADFNITNISVSNAAFSISPTSFNLKDGESKTLIVSFLPPDSGYIYCKFTFENDLCPSKFYASGGFPGKKAAMRTLKLIQPNGGEVFLAGSDTIITWEGISPDEPVTIEYRTDDNQPWVKLTDSAKGLSYKFHVPKIASDKYLARVSAKEEYELINDSVKICNQIWMRYNLDVDHYRNGDSIPEVRNSTQWANLNYGAWCYYNNDPANGKIYGKLYNWYAVNDPRGLAPVGWHIPSDQEWKQLEICLGGDSLAGGKMKETGTSHWLSPNYGASNSSGFTAIPAGYQVYLGNFFSIGTESLWWTSTNRSSASSWGRNIDYDSSILYLFEYDQNFGLSVRCVRD